MTSALDLSRLSRAVLAIALASALGGCAGAGGASRLAEPPAFEPEGQSKCSVRKSQARPLIVEWPSADRGALEAQTRKGIVAVRYDGCEMEVLRQCRAAGAYAYGPVTPKEDRIAIRTADELYAHIPVHAAKFEGKLKAAGELDVQMTIVGTYEADRNAVRLDELQGDCRAATHVILALSAGAFEFTAASGAEVSAGGGGLGIAGAGDSSATRELLNRDGYRSACERATSSDTAPPDGCGALLRVEVVPLAPALPPIAGAPPPYAYPYAAPPLAPPPMPPPPRLEREPRSAQGVAGILGVTVGAAGLMMGFVAGGIAVGQDVSLSKVCQDSHCGPSQAGALDGYHTATTLSTIGFIAGGAAMVGGIVLLATSPPRGFKKPASALGAAWRP